MTGAVRDTVGKPIAGARVEAYDLQGNPLDAITTNENGEFVLLLRVGIEVTIRVSAPGYNDGVAYIKPVEGYNQPITVVLSSGALTPPPPPVFPE